MQDESLHLPLLSLDTVASKAYDIIVVGAGVVGSALAASLAASGRSVLLVERSYEKPDRIVGELLQPRGILALQSLGLDHCLTGIDAQVCRGYSVFWDDKAVNIPYPPKTVDVPGLATTCSAGMRNSGVQEGRSFHHGAFVQSLRREAARQQRLAMFEGSVTDLIRCGESQRVIGVRVVSSSQSDTRAKEKVALSVDLLAPLTIVADGCFSKFRRTILPQTSSVPVVRSNFVALLLKDAVLPEPGHGHVFLPSTKPADSALGSEAIGPVLVYQLDQSESRMLVDVPGEKPPSLRGDDLQSRLAEHITSRLPQSLVPSFSAALAASKGPAGSTSRLRSMPNSWLPPHPQHRIPAVEGCVLVGDALSMRHPLTGGGMTVGLNDVVHLVQCLGGGLSVGALPALHTPDIVSLQDWSEVTSALRLWYSLRKSTASTVNILAQALYRLFGADGADLEVLKRGCFSYFELGGECVQGPVSLLSALSPSRGRLFYHFFSVAFYSIMLLFQPRHRSPSPVSPFLWPNLVHRSLSVVCDT